MLLLLFFRTAYEAPVVPGLVRLVWMLLEVGLAVRSGVVETTVDDEKEDEDEDEDADNDEDDDGENAGDVCLCSEMGTQIGRPWTIRSFPL